MLADLKSPRLRAMPAAERCRWKVAMGQAALPRTRSLAEVCRRPALACLSVLLRLQGMAREQLRLRAHRIERSTHLQPLRRTLTGA